jgi:hypothetical protein
MDLLKPPHNGAKAPQNFRRYNLLTLYVILYVCAVVCFAAAAANLYPKLNLLALGLVLFTLVPLLQVGQRAF